MSNYSATSRYSLPFPPFIFPCYATNSFLIFCLFVQLQDALEPYMSLKMLESHWGEYHRGHVEALNNHLSRSDILYGYTMDELVKVTYNYGNPLPEFNDAAQVLLTYIYI